MDKKALVSIKKFKKKVEKDFPLDTVIFFGSRSNKNYTKDSDIDLIMVSKKFKRLNFFKRVAKMYDYWDFKYPVDFICYTPEEFDKLKKRISIVSEALEEGVMV